MTWIKGNKFWLAFSEPYHPPHNLGYKMGNLTQETLVKAAENIKDSPDRRSWVIYPPIELVWVTKFKEKTIMEKLEIKMARFVELSMKFSVAEEHIEEIQDLKDLVPLTPSNPSMSSHGSIWIGDEVSYPGQEESKVKSFQDKVEEGVTARWKVYEEYREYLELQNTLNTYFKASKKI